MIGEKEREMPLSYDGGCGDPECELCKQDHARATERYEKEREMRKLVRGEFA